MRVPWKSHSLEKRSVRKSSHGVPPESVGRGGGGQTVRVWSEHVRLSKEPQTEGAEEPAPTPSMDLCDRLPWILTNGTGSKCDLIL